jgi:hypothetical protein
LTAYNVKNEATPLLLLGVSRSGTTLFQRILNSYDDVIIWGEHDGYISDIANSYYKIVDSESMEAFSYPQSAGDEIELDEYKDPKQWQAWNNWFNKNDIKEIYKQFLIKTFAASWENELTYWGFKEIRYGEGDRVTEFFIDTFPGAKMVIIFRNPLNVIESQLSSFENIGGRLAKIRKILLIPKIYKMAIRWNKKNLSYLTHFKKYPDSINYFSFEEIVADEKKLSSVLAWLGLELTDIQRNVLNMKEGRGSAFSKVKNASTNTRWKKLGLLPSAIVYFTTWSVYNKIRAETEKIDI